MGLKQEFEIFDTQPFGGGGGIYWALFSLGFVLHNLLHWNKGYPVE